MNRAVYEIVLSEGADADLAQIHAYLAAHASLDDADRVLDMIMTRLDALVEFPDRGSIPKELDALGINQFRQLIAAHYRLFYEVIDRRVLVLLCADGRRDMRTLLQARLLRPS